MLQVQVPSCVISQGPAREKGAAPRRRPHRLPISFCGGPPRKQILRDERPETIQAPCASSLALWRRASVSSGRFLGTPQPCSDSRSGRTCHPESGSTVGGTDGMEGPARKKAVPSPIRVRSRFCRTQLGEPGLRSLMEPSPHPHLAALGPRASDSGSLGSQWPSLYSKAQNTHTMGFMGRTAE